MRQDSYVVDVFHRDFCPLHCDYCYLRRVRGGLSDSRLAVFPYYLAQWLSESGIRRVSLNFRYGEPLSSIRDVYNMIHILQAFDIDVFHVNIATSAVIYSPILLDILSSRDTSVNISIDGPWPLNKRRAPTPQLHRHIVGVISRYLEKIPPQSVSALTTVHDLNVDKQRSVIEYLAHLGFRRLMMSPVDDGVPFVLAGTYGKYAVSSIEAFLWAYDAWRSGDLDIYVAAPVILEWVYSWGSPAPPSCGPIRRASLVVSYDYRVYPCIQGMLLYMLDPKQYSAFLLGDLREATLPEMMDQYVRASELVRGLRELQENNYAREYGFSLGCALSILYFSKLHNTSVEKVMRMASDQIQAILPDVQEMISSYNRKELMEYSRRATYGEKL